MLLYELQIDIPDGSPKAVLITEILTRAMSGLAMDGVDSALSIRKYDEGDCTCGDHEGGDGEAAECDGAG